MCRWTNKILTQCMIHIRASENALLKSGPEQQALMVHLDLFPIFCLWIRFSKRFSMRPWMPAEVTAWKQEHSGEWNLELQTGSFYTWTALIILINRGLISPQVLKSLFLQFPLGQLTLNGKTDNPTVTIHHLSVQRSWAQQWVTHKPENLSKFNCFFFCNHCLSFYWKIKIEHF